MSKTIPVTINMPVGTYNKARALVNLRSRENPRGNYDISKLAVDAIDSFVFKIVSEAFDSHIMKGEGI